MGRCWAAGRGKSFDKLKKNKTPPKPRCGRGRNEESCGNGEREEAIVIPLIAGLVEVRVEPPTTVVAVRVEDVRVAVRSVRGAIHATAR